MKLRIASYGFALVVACVLAASLALVGDDTVVAKDKDEKAAAPKDERIYMMNALWFKPDGGKEKYMQYMMAAGPFAAKYGAKNHGLFAPEFSVIGKFDADLIFFVEWPNEKAFLSLIQDEGYKAISHLRSEAISDSLLIRCRSLN